MKKILLILLLTGGTVLAQVARPTFNPFTNNGFNYNQQFNGQRPNYGFQNNRFQNNGFQNNGFQNNGFQNNGFQNNRFQNNGFQNNGFQQGGFSGQFYPSSQGRGRPVYNNRGQQQNNGLQNNGFNNSQQQGNSQTSNPQLFTRRYHLNNGYLYGRPTSLWYDPKSSKMQPWVRKNLR